MGWSTRPLYVEAEPCQPVYIDIGTVVPGYSAALPLGNLQTLSPAPVAITPLLGSAIMGSFPLGTPSRDPNVGAFIRDAGVVAGSIGELQQGQYLPVNLPDDTVGTFVVGESAIDVPPQLHGELP